MSKYLERTERKGKIVQEDVKKHDVASDQADLWKNEAPKKFFQRLFSIMKKMVLSVIIFISAFFVLGCGIFLIEYKPWNNPEKSIDKFNEDFRKFMEPIRFWIRVGSYEGISNEKNILELKSKIESLMKMSEEDMEKDIYGEYVYEIFARWTNIDPEGLLSYALSLYDNGKEQEENMANMGIYVFTWIMTEKYVNGFLEFYIENKELMENCMNRNNMLTATVGSAYVVANREEEGWRRIHQFVSNKLKYSFMVGFFAGMRRNFLLESQTEEGGYLKIHLHYLNELTSKEENCDLFKIFSQENEEGVKWNGSWDNLKDVPFYYLHLYSWRLSAKEGYEKWISTRPESEERIISTYLKSEEEKRRGR